MLKRLQATQAGWGTTLVRIVMAIIFIKEGSGKLLGWFGGEGFSASCAYFTHLGIPFPVFNTFLVSSIEFFGGLAFLVGFLTRPAAIPIAITMVMAILTAHRDGGWQYPLLIFSTCAALLEAGSGALSLDRFLSQR